MSRVETERAVALKLSLLARQWQALGDQGLARLGVSNSAGWCLYHLNRLGENARQSDLARAVGVRDATLARTLAQLESAALIERHPNPSDARANIMRITPLGLQKLEEIDVVLATLRHDILQDVTDAELQTVVSVFERVDAQIAKRRR